MTRPQDSPEAIADRILAEATANFMAGKTSSKWSEADETYVDRAVATRDPDEPMWKPARRRTR